MIADPGRNPEHAPLADLEEWDDDVKRRYPEPAAASDSPGLNPTDPGKPREAFRDYRAGVRPSVREFYRLNHLHQTVDFVRGKRAEYLPLRRKVMSTWEALDYLNTLVDDSDPDTNVPQIEHALQSAEAARHDDQPRWFVLTALIHDLGKVMCLYGEPQWAVVGDTFPVGCRWSEKIVFSEFFAHNPDRNVAKYQTPCGIYEPGGGLDQVLMSWGHDEYLFHVVRDYLPTEALYMIRYHSFYAAHREREYEHLMNDLDRQMFDWVRRFNPYDLYTKSQERPDVAALRPFYEELVHEFLPEKLHW